MNLRAGAAAPPREVVAVVGPVLAVLHASTPPPTAPTATGSRGDAQHAHLASARKMRFVRTYGAKQPAAKTVGHLTKITSLHYWVFGDHGHYFLKRQHAYSREI